MRAPRMPRIDELPIPAQNQIAGNRGDAGEDHPEKRRMSLMQRLASVGLGKRADERTGAARRTANAACSSGRSSGRPPGNSRRPPAEVRMPENRQPEGRVARSGIGVCTPPRGRRVLTCTAGRHLCITTARKTSWIFRPSCVVRRTERRNSGKPPFQGAAGIFFAMALSLQYLNFISAKLAKYVFGRVCLATVSRFQQ